MSGSSSRPWYCMLNFKKLNASSVCFRAFATRYIFDPDFLLRIPTAKASAATKLVLPLFLAVMMNVSLYLVTSVPV